MLRPRLSVSGLMLLVLALGVGFIALRLASRAWAGVMLFLTLGVLLTAILGAIYRNGPRRAFWVGFALFGWCYMLVTARIWLDHEGPDLITIMLFGRPPHQVGGRPGAGAVESVLAQLRTGYAAEEQYIFAKLDQPIPISFPKQTPLEDALKYIKAATQGPNDSGIPIYVDPIGLQEAEKNMRSKVAIDVSGVPLRTSLRLLLKQLGLVYSVQGGLMTITSESLARDDADSFARISHCCAAIVVAYIGALIARAFWATRERRPTSYDTTAPVQLDPAPAVQP